MIKSEEFMINKIMKKILYKPMIQKRINKKTIKIAINLTMLQKNTEKIYFLFLGLAISKQAKSIKII